jgi:hypothetical protein
MKNILETTGSFQIVDADTGTLVRFEGYTVAPPSNFSQSRIALGQLSVKGQVNDDATDEEWLKYVAESDGNLDLALEAFVSAYPVDGVGAPEQDPKANKKPAAKK